MRALALGSKSIIMIALQKFIAILNLVEPLVFIIIFQWIRYVYRELWHQLRKMVVIIHVCLHEKED